MTEPDKSICASVTACLPDIPSQHTSDSSLRGDHLPWDEFNEAGFHSDDRHV